MSDHNHTGEKQVPFWLDEALISKLDQAILALGYKTRAEWFREQIRNTIERASQK